MYTVIILNADHHNGAWRGCAKVLGRQIRKSERWCQYILASLRSKGYITGTPSNGRGQYPIRVNKYFSTKSAQFCTDFHSQKAHQRSPSGPEGAPAFTLSAKKAHPRSPLQEVIQEKREEVDLGAENRAKAHPPFLFQNRKQTTNQQRDFAIVSRLAFQAEKFIAENPLIESTDLAEDLKLWAAECRIPYGGHFRGGNSFIEQSIKIARERQRCPVRADISRKIYTLARKKAM